MTELEKLERAKACIDKLANGVNPLNGTVIPDSEIVNQVQLSRCFFFVSDVLRRVIEQGGIKLQSKTKKCSFALSYEERNLFSYSDMPIPVSELTKRINALKPDDTMKNLNYTNITSWLLDIGMLKLESLPDNKTGKRPTAAGIESGITVEERISARGPYHVVVYDKKAQEFILDNLDAIIEVK